MSGKRRVGAEQSATRRTILDATQELMVENGYAAVSARRVAAKAGVKPALVQYYFPTMDELLLALYRRSADQVAERQQEALASVRPLHALWELTADAGRTALGLEFMALANHRETIRAELARYAARSRDLQAEALSRLLSERGLDPESFPAGGVSLLLGGAARGLVMEQNLGVTDGHDEARAIVERWLDSIEKPDRSR
jgi:AcrR family transcriptional regulator